MRTEIFLDEAKCKKRQEENERRDFERLKAKFEHTMTGANNV